MPKCTTRAFECAVIVFNHSALYGRCVFFLINANSNGKPCKKTQQQMRYKMRRDHVKFILYDRNKQFTLENCEIFHLPSLSFAHFHCLLRPANLFKWILNINVALRFYVGWLLLRVDLKRNCRKTKRQPKQKPITNLSNRKSKNKEEERKNELHWIELSEWMCKKKEKRVIRIKRKEKKDKSVAVCDAIMETNGE